MITIQTLRAFMDDENTIVAACQQSLTQIWERAAGLPPEQMRDLLLDLFPALIDRYGSQSAAHSADLYDEMRAHALPNGPRFTALAQAGYSDERLTQVIRETARWLWTDTPDTMLSTLTGRMDKYVKQAGRNTMWTSAKRDPAKPRFARVPVGETCAFCRMLASRGFVYDSERTAGDRMKKFHPDCDCMIVPGWNGHTTITGYDPDVHAAEWDAASGDLAMMRQGTGENTSHYRRKRVDPSIARDLEEYARQFLPGARLAGFTDIRDAEQARSQLSALETLLGKYPDQRNKIEVLAFHTSKDGDPRGEWKSPKLILDTATYTPKEFAWDIANGFHHSTRDVNPGVYTATHEFGHILDEHSTASRDFRHQIERMTGKRNLDALTFLSKESSTSVYGSFEWFETLAEAFATIELSPQIATDVERLAHEILTKGGPR